MMVSHNTNRLNCFGLIACILIIFAPTLGYSDTSIQLDGSTSFTETGEFIQPTLKGNSTSWFNVTHTWMTWFPSQTLRHIVPTTWHETVVSIWHTTYTAFRSHTDALTQTYQDYINVTNWIEHSRSVWNTIGAWTHSVWQQTRAISDTLLTSQPWILTGLSKASMLLFFPAQRSAPHVWNTWNDNLFPIGDEYTLPSAYSWSREQFEIPSQIQTPIHASVIPDVILMPAPPLQPQTIPIVPPYINPTAHVSNLTSLAVENYPFSNINISSTNSANTTNTTKLVPIIASKQTVLEQQSKLITNASQRASGQTVTTRVSLSFRTGLTRTTTVHARRNKTGALRDSTTIINSTTIHATHNPMYRLIASMDASKLQSVSNGSSTYRVLHMTADRIADITRTTVVFVAEKPITVDQKKQSDFDIVARVLIQLVPADTLLHMDLPTLVLAVANPEVDVFNSMQPISYALIAHIPLQPGAEMTLRTTDGVIVDRVTMANTTWWHYSDCPFSSASAKGTYLFSPKLPNSTNGGHGRQTIDLSTLSVGGEDTTKETTLMLFASVWAAAARGAIVNLEEQNRVRVASQQVSVITLRLSVHVAVLVLLYFASCWFDEGTPGREQLVALCTKLRLTSVIKPAKNQVSTSPITGKLGRRVAFADPLHTSSIASVSKRIRTA